MAHVEVTQSSCKRMIKDRWATDIPDNSEGRYLRPCYFDDEEMVDELDSGMFYQDTYFAEDVEVNERVADELDVPIKC